MSSVVFFEVTSPSSRGFLYIQTLLLVFIVVTNYHDIYSFVSKKKTAPNGNERLTENKNGTQGAKIGSKDEEESNPLDHEIYKSNNQDFEGLDDVFFNEEKHEIEKGGQKFFGKELSDKDLNIRVGRNTGKHAGKGQVDIGSPKSFEVDE